MSLLTQFYGGGGSSSSTDSAVSFGGITSSAYTGYYLVGPEGGKAPAEPVSASIPSLASLQTGMVTANVRSFILQPGGNVDTPNRSRTGGQVNTFDFTGNSATGYYFQNTILETGNDFTTNWGNAQIISGLNCQLVRSGTTWSWTANSLTTLSNCTIRIDGASSTSVITAPNLTTVTNCVFTGGSGSSLSITGTKLTAESVNNMLISMDLNGMVSCTINLSGGTAAGTSSLSTAGAAALATLISVGRGNTITLNA